MQQINVTNEVPAELEPESQRIMGGMTESETEFLKISPTEMIVLSFDDLKEPSLLRLLAMEWVMENISKNDKRLASLPRALKEELEARQSLMGEQRRSKWMK